MNAEEQFIAGKVANRAWRLGNLYWIEDENGKKVKFRLNWAQRAFFSSMWWLNTILKARQLGLSTFIMILELDRSLFNSNQTCGIIDKTQPDASKKLARIAFAYDHLDDPDDPTTAHLGAAVKQAVGLAKANTKELEFTNGSKIWCGTSLRGGTVQFLWISELGYIAFFDPKRAAEIKAGALNTVHAGNIVVIESTHEGGKYGLNYEMIKVAQAAPPPEKMTTLDWRFHFYAWHKNPNYILPLVGPLELKKEEVDYFRDLEKNEGIGLTAEQKHWYVKKERVQGDAMKKEHPSTPEEALNAVVTGAIYGKIVSKLRRERRIVDFVHSSEVPLYSFFDIGYSDFGTVWLIQMVGRDILALDYYSAHNENAAHFANKLVEWEREYGQPIVCDYLPHDADHKEKGSGKSFLDFFKEAGRKTTKIVPRVPDLWVGINALRALLPRFMFHLTKTAVEFKGVDVVMPSGITCVEAYHTKVDDSGATIQEAPVHDAYSHGASALRTFAEAHMRGMLEGTSTTARETRTGERKVITGLSTHRPITRGFRVIR